MKHLSKNLLSLFATLIFTIIFLSLNSRANALSFGICGPATLTNGNQTQTFNINCGDLVVLPYGGTLTFEVCAYGDLLDDLTLTSGPLPPGATFPTASGIQYSHSTFTWTQTSSFIGDIVFYVPGLDCTLHFDRPLPVELSSFTSIVNGNNLTLNWQTSSESNNSEFVVERSKLNNGNISDWNQAGSVRGNGNTSTVSDYTFTDRSLSSGVYNYRLKQIDFNGNFEYHYLSNNVNIGAPEKFELSQNYPNPFNPSTVINFTLTKSENISLKVYNSSGIEVKTIDEGFKNAGFYSVRFDGKDLASGIYYYKLVSGSPRARLAEQEAGNFTAVKKMMLVK